MEVVSIKNIDRLIQKVENLSTIDVEKVVKKATTFVHGQATNLCRVDTGRLRSSIHMNVERKEAETIGKVYTNCEYAPYVEFGTGVRGNGSYPYELEKITLEYKEDWAGQRAQPFLYPALKGSEKYIDTMIKNSVRENIRKICGGGK